ncbi:MAG: Mini-ribonuclease 3 [Clostridia bacterium]|nr:Mini-ribonuclease 3 [Clostridia bacterium]MDE7401125.1 Mini-ribonuclease 3 [Clostridia bacterium]
MDKCANLFDFFTKISKESARQLSPVTLAFVGDAVYSLYVREREVLRSDDRLNELQKRTTAAVSAKGQSELLLRLEGKFTPEEEEIFHRGRNAKKSTKAKNASVVDYNRSTGFEAVLGFLYLSGQYDRISQLLEE